MKKIVSVCSFMFICISLVSAGPFGIEMGDSLEDLKNLGLNPTEVLGRPGYYDIYPKKMHPDMKNYFVQLDEDKGVYFIKGLSVFIQDEGDGSNIRLHFDEIRKELERVYGEGVLYSVLLSYATLTKPEEWLKAVQEEERIHIAAWESTDGAVFPGNIDRLYLNVYVIFDGVSRLEIEYYSKDFDELSRKSQEKASPLF